MAPQDRLVVRGARTTRMAQASRPAGGAGASGPAFATSAPLAGASAGRLSSMRSSRVLLVLLLSLCASLGVAQTAPPAPPALPALDDATTASARLTLSGLAPAPASGPPAALEALRQALAAASGLPALQLQTQSATLSATLLLAATPAAAWDAQASAQLVALLSTDIGVAPARISLGTVAPFPAAAGRRSLRQATGLAVPVSISGFGGDFTISAAASAVLAAEGAGLNPALALPAWAAGAPLTTTGITLQAPPTLAVVAIVAASAASSGAASDANKALANAIAAGSGVTPPATVAVTATAPSGAPAGGDASSPSEMSRWERLGPIIGGCAGGGLLVICCLCACMACARRKRAAKDDAAAAEAQGGATVDGKMRGASTAEAGSDDVDAASVSVADSAGSDAASRRSSRRGGRADRIPAFDVRKKAEPPAAVAVEEAPAEEDDGTEAVAQSKAACAAARARAAAARAAVAAADAEQYATALAEAEAAEQAAEDAEDAAASAAARAAVARVRAGVPCTSTRVVPRRGSLPPDERTLCAPNALSPGWALAPTLHALTAQFALEDATAWLRSPPDVSRTARAATPPPPPLPLAAALLPLPADVNAACVKEQLAGLERRQAAQRSATTNTVLSYDERVRPYRDDDADAQPPAAVAQRFVRRRAVTEPPGARRDAVPPRERRKPAAPPATGSAAPLDVAYSEDEEVPWAGLPPVAEATPVAWQAADARALGLPPPRVTAPRPGDSPYDSSVGTPAAAPPAADDSAGRYREALAAAKAWRLRQAVGEGRPGDASELSISQPPSPTQARRM